MMPAHDLGAPDVVALDGSQASERAALFAVSLAHHERRGLVFVYVYDQAEPPDDVDARLPFLEKASHLAASAGLAATTSIRYGRARHEILEAAREFDSRFVFVGASRRNSVERWVLGDVAAEVVRHSDKPVIVVPPVANLHATAGTLFSRMLVAIDPQSEETSPAASALALAAGTSRAIVFCTVVDENHFIQLASEGEGGLALGELIPILDAEAQRAVDAATAAARAIGIAAEGVFVRGQPASEICKLAREKDVTSIVVGTHGRQGLSRMMGSTTVAVLNAAQVPVITFRLGHGLVEPNPPPPEVSGT